MKAVTQMLRLREVLKRTGMSRSQIYRMEAEGSFPKRIKLSLRVSAWIAAEIEQWLLECIERARK